MGESRATRVIDGGAEKSAKNSEGSALYNRVQFGKQSSCCHIG